MEDRSPGDESIVAEEGTRGTETSKYPEEEKEKSIPLVVASEEGTGQTERLRRFGVADHQREAARELNPMERGTRGGNSPVSEAQSGQMAPEYRGTREILREAGGTTPQA